MVQKSCRAFEWAGRYSVSVWRTTSCADEISLICWMELIDAEVCVESGKCDCQDLRLRRADEWSLILKRYDWSGFTQAAFGTREDLRFGTLVAYRAWTHLVRCGWLGPHFLSGIH
jgi:hypothetical protein